MVTRKCRWDTQKQKEITRSFVELELMMPGLLSRYLCFPQIQIRSYLFCLAITILICGMIFFPAMATAQENPLKQSEKQARQLARQLLSQLKQIDAWVEKSPGESRQEAAPVRFVEVTGRRVNIRTGPSTDNSVLKTALRGETFEYIESTKDWHVIQFDEHTTGYLSADFGRLTEPMQPAKGSKQVTAESAERLDPRFSARARKILRDNQRGATVLEFVTDEAEEMYRRQFGDFERTPVGAHAAAAKTSLTRIRKYRRLALAKYDRYAELAGETRSTGDGEPAAAPLWKKTVHGTVRAGFGSNTAETKQNGQKTAETDVARMDLAVDVTAMLTPDDQLHVEAGRRGEIRFAPETRTRAGVTYQRRLGEKAQVAGGFRLKKYENDFNDSVNVDQTEITVQAAANPSPQIRVRGNLSVAGASYPNDDRQDYGDTRFGLGANGGLAGGTKWGLSYSAASHDADFDSLKNDYTQNRLEGNLTFKTGDRSTLSLVASAEGYGFEEDKDPRSYARQGLKMILRGGNNAGNSTTTTLEFRKKDFDDRDDGDYTEFRGEIRTSSVEQISRKNKSMVSVNYRNYADQDNSTFLDYLETRIDFTREAHKQRGVGVFWESNTYAQYFFENNDIERNAQINQFMWLGIIGGTSQTVKVGPHLGANTEFIVDSEAVDAQGNSLGTFESPNNTIRYGIKGSVAVNPRPLRIRGAGRYEIIEYYNIDNSSSPQRLELEGEGIYDINKKIATSVKFKYYRTGTDAAESNEFDVLFAVLYRFDSR
ncbi:SH3 domain-containing protein [Candidatus Zixiibacteriota bacterium]